MGTSKRQPRRRRPSPCAGATRSSSARPATPTPRKTKRLPDIDDQETLRSYVPFILFYRGGLQAGPAPAGVIRRALGEALVHYYPLAGRLRQVEGRKLVVDCTGEGVIDARGGPRKQRLEELEAVSLVGKH